MAPDQCHLKRFEDLLTSLFNEIAWFLINDVSRISAVSAVRQI